VCADGERTRQRPGHPKSDITKSAFYWNAVTQGSGTYGSRATCGSLMTASDSLDIFLT